MSFIFRNAGRNLPEGGSKEPMTKVVVSKEDLMAWISGIESQDQQAQETPKIPVQETLRVQEMPRVKARDYKSAL